MTAPINYTTKISAAQTVGEMQALLAEHGASRISVDYVAGSPTALGFALSTPHGERIFSLPVNVEAMHLLLLAEDKAGRLKTGTKSERASLAQAERVAWRVVQTWLAAQLALVATQMVTVDEVMLPYLTDAAGVTLYDKYRARETAALENGANHA